MRRAPHPFFWAVPSALLMTLGQPASSQAPDLLADRSVRLLVEEVLIADLMLRSCEGLIASEGGVAEVQAIADELARRAGYTPEEAAARLEEPAARAEIEAGARRRLTMMGARPEDPDAVCAVASRVIGGGGVLGALLSLPGPETE